MKYLSDFVFWFQAFIYANNTGSMVNSLLGFKIVIPIPFLSFLRH